MESGALSCSLDVTSALLWSLRPLPGPPGPQLPYLYNGFLRKAAMQEYRLGPKPYMAYSRNPGAFPGELSRDTALLQ